MQALGDGVVELHHFATRLLFVVDDQISLPRGEPHIGPPRLSDSRAAPAVRPPLRKRGGISPQRSQKADVPSHAVACERIVGVFRRKRTNVASLAGMAGAGAGAGAALQLAPQTIDSGAQLIELGQACERPARAAGEDRARGGARDALRGAAAARRTTDCRSTSGWRHGPAACWRRELVQQARVIGVMIFVVFIHGLHVVRGQAEQTSVRRDDAILVRPYTGQTLNFTMAPTFTTSSKSHLEKDNQANENSVSRYRNLYRPTG